MTAALSDIELLSRLVAIDTTSRLATRPFGDFVADYLDSPAVRIERFGCGDGHENMLIAVGPECRAGEGLLLCGHVDTVPADEPEWTSDPRVLTVRSAPSTPARAIARGACDMKGFDALAINLLREAIERPPSEPLLLLLTCNEEVGTLGAAAFAKAWPRERRLPLRTLVGEPTSMRVVRGHKGHLTISIVTHGIAAHSGFPHKGVNAIERAAVVVQALAVVRKELTTRRTPESVLFPEVPFPVLTSARIHGGSAINVIPERCDIDVGVRLLPGMDSVPFLDHLRRSVEAVVPQDAVTVTLRNETPAFATPAERPWHAEMCELVGQEGEFGVGFGTDAGRLAALGVEPMIWGPGDISNAHRPDEWMPLDEFERASHLLRQLVR
ncbi:MAG: M20 family metallopeptidase [Phycisphaerae bacterium]|nr:M20 family metallopeptidase [Phycisphaerae bacterium]